MAFFGGIFVLFFVLIAGAILYAIVQAITQAIKNTNSPILTVPAQIVAKRSEMSGGQNDTSVRTSYYVTFEMQGGERREWDVASQKYGLLVEGDRGTLTYQETWFKDFTRSAAYSDR